MRNLKRLIADRRKRGATLGDFPVLFGSLMRFGLLKVHHKNIDASFFTSRHGFDMRISPQAKVVIGGGVSFLQDFTGRFAGSVTIGDNVFFNRGCYLSVQERLVIGNNCRFGEYVAIHDENHVLLRTEGEIHFGEDRTSPIRIGTNVWVGAKATILSGVVIGDNVIIGANAVVTRDIPDNSVAVGAPAKVIRRSIE